MATDPSFTVTTESGFNDDRIWVIRVTLRYRDGFPGDNTDLLGEGRLALLVAIAEEGRKGRSLGATVAEVLLDEGRGELVKLDADGVIGRMLQQ